MSELITHMIARHYLEKIKQRFSGLYNSDTGECTVCGKTYNKYVIWRHLGAVHFKLEEILESEKRRPLRSAVMPRIMKVGDDEQ